MQKLEPWKTKKAWGSIATAAVSLTLLGAQPSIANPLTFNKTPLGNVVAQMKQNLGINISIKGAYDPNLPVTFTADNTGIAAQRVQAVNNLANALGADFQKAYVVSPAAPGATSSPIAVDTNADVAFASTSLSATQAIQTVAGADGAVAQISSGVTGNVNLSDRVLNTRQAAAEIARQTHTKWKIYYAIFKPGQAPKFAGQVVGQSNDGHPIIKIPLQTASSGTSAAHQQALDAQQAAEQQAADQQANADTNNDGTNNGDNGDNSAYNNGDGYNNNGYSNDPYAYPGYSTDPYGFGYPPSIGYDGSSQPGLFVNTNPYAVFSVGPNTGSAGSPYPFISGSGIGAYFSGSTYGNNGVTILPSFPYMGGYGGPVVIGGY